MILVSIRRYTLRRCNRNGLRSSHYAQYLNPSLQTVNYWPAFLGPGVQRLASGLADHGPCPAPRCRPQGCAAPRRASILSSGPFPAGGAREGEFWGGPRTRDTAYTFLFDFRRPFLKVLSFRRDFPQKHLPLSRVCHVFRQLFSLCGGISDWAMRGRLWWTRPPFALP